MPKIKINARLLLTLFFLFLFLSHAFLAAAQEGGKRVISVSVKGNQAISTSTILSKIKTAPNTTFSQETVNDDIKRLYALGYFTDVAIDAEDFQEGVMVTVIVEEKPVVKEIIFDGNSSMRDAKLKKVMQTKEGDMLNFGKLSEDIVEIKSLYERNGFHDTDARYHLEKDENNQITIKISVKEKRRMRIKRVYIEGNKNAKKSKLLELMQTRPAWLFNRGYFDETAFQNDQAKIKAYYQDLGFLDVSIEPEFRYEEDKGLIYITLKITEGDRYYAGTITITGNIVFPEQEVRKAMLLKEGDVFSYGALRNSVEEVRGLYYKEGYMNVVIDVDRMINPEAHRIDIALRIDAKDIVYIGTVNISGNSKTKDIVIRRELRAYPGERFDGDKIRRSKERLYNLGFFEDIYFETSPTERSNVNNLDISVKETKTGEFAFGGGYSSVDQFIGFVQVTQRNFDLLNFPYFTGDGQNLILRAEIGLTRNDFDLSWTEPWIFDYPLAFGVDGYHRTHLRRTHVGYGYREVRSGGDLRLGKEFLEYFNTSLMYRLENVDISDVTDEATQDLRDEQGRNWVSSLIWGISFDNRDNIFSPTRGFFTGTSLETSGGFLLGDKDYMKGYLWTNYYYSPIKNIVIEFKARAGLADSYLDTDKVPIYERFYAGGMNTIRGYGERRVGPRDPASNDPIGGEAMIVGNAELTFPIYEKVIKGAIFYDVGNVWANIGDFTQGGYKQGAGVGIRVKTPIGPIKLDWGYPLSDNQGDERKGEFYFSVSHGF